MLLSDILLGECTGHPKERKYSECIFVLLLEWEPFPFRELPSNTLFDKFGDFSLLLIFLGAGLYRLAWVALESSCSCPWYSEWQRALSWLNGGSFGCWCLRLLSEKAWDKLERLCCWLRFSIFSLIALMCWLIWRWFLRLSVMASESSSLEEWVFMFIWRS